MSFRDNLQHLRATRGMTQEQLAEQLGVSRQSVTKWESEEDALNIESAGDVFAITCTRGELSLIAEGLYAVQKTGQQCLEDEIPRRVRHAGA